MQKRLRELQTGNSNVLEIVTTYASPVGTLLETALHRSYPLIHNEWFSLTDAEVVEFPALCKRLEASIQALANNSYWNRHDPSHRPPDDEW